MMVRGENKAAPRSRSSHLKNMHGTDLLMELIRDIANELDVNVLSHKILLNCCALLKSDKARLVARCKVYV